MSWRPPGKIRLRAIGLGINNGKVLVCEVLDDIGQLKGWAPPGGGIEFGERAEAGLKREISEELGCSVSVLKPPFITETLFTHHEVVGHEVVFAFPVKFENPEIYEKSRFQIKEDNGSLHWVEWVEIEKFTSRKERLFPEEIVDYVNGLQN